MGVSMGVVPAEPIEVLKSMLKEMPSGTPWEGVVTDTHTLPLPTPSLNV